MTADATESLTNPPRLANALRENHPPTMCTNCAALSSHQDTFPTSAAPEPGHDDPVEQRVHAQHGPGDGRHDPLLDGEVDGVREQLRHAPARHLRDGRGLAQQAQERGREHVDREQEERRGEADDPGALHVSLPGAHRLPTQRLQRATHAEEEAVDDGDGGQLHLADVAHEGHGDEPQPELEDLGQDHRACDAPQVLALARPSSCARPPSPPPPPSLPVHARCGATV
jgi:hypothetical protein